MNKYTDDAVIHGVQYNIFQVIQSFQTLVTVLENTQRRPTEGSWDLVGTWINYLAEDLRVLNVWSADLDRFIDGEPL